MAEVLVREWLADCKAQSPSDVQNMYYITVQNNDVIQGLFTLLEERTKNYEVLEGICNQLFGFYRSALVDLHRFALQYLPSLVYTYLGSLAQGDKKTVKCIEVFLLGVYNLEVVDDAGKPKVLSFRLPSVCKPSIYHMPLSLTSAALTENSVSRLERGDNQQIAFGPFPQVENLNAHNRMKVLTVLMNVYNRNLTFMPKPALHSLCKTCSRLSRQGFGKQNSHHRSSFGSESVFGSQYSRPPARIPLTSSFLLEILHGVYFSLNNGLGPLGLQALDDLHFRANYELMADVLLVVDAIRNSLHFPSGHTGEGTMGINISISPTTSMTTVSKSAVTNASFRTRKLPDDIPIQNVAEEANEASSSLATISEEAEEGGDRGQQHVKLKESKEKGKAQLINMISKIGGGKSKEKGDKGVPSSGTAIGGSTTVLHHTANGTESKRKESDPTVHPKSTRKESDSSTKGVVEGIVNGEALGSAKNPFKADGVVNQKNASGRLQAYDALELKSLKSGSGSREHLKSVGGSETSSQEARNDAVSISSTHSSIVEDDGKVFLGVSPINAATLNLVAQQSPCTEIHSTV